MPKRAKELSAIEVKRMNQSGFHAVGGVSGLPLRINDGEGKSWILRKLVKGKRRDIGLGGFPDVPLVDARKPLPGNGSIQAPRASSSPCILFNLGIALKSKLSVARQWFEGKP